MLAPAVSGRPQRNKGRAKHPVADDIRVWRQRRLLEFLLEDQVPAKKLELNASLRRRIRRQLMLDMGHIKNGDSPKALEAERAKAKIEIPAPGTSDPKALVDPNRVIAVVNDERFLAQSITCAWSIWKESASASETPFSASSRFFDDAAASSESG